MLVVYIMAGGKGERFWPLSTKEKPKQLLKLIDPERSMIRMTVERVMPLVPSDKIFVGTNAVQAEVIKAELPMLPKENIIIEPEFKDTAAAIGFGAASIYEKLKLRREKIKEINGDDNYISKENISMIVLASDHIIRNEENFRKRLVAGVKTAKRDKSIVTFGIKPTKPETGYGYIETDECYIGEPANVKRFWEKPSFERAEQYIAKGNYLWNSGMFIFTLDTLFSAFQEHMPGHYTLLENIMQVFEKHGVPDHSVISDIYKKFEKISIDFGIMEKAKNTKVIPVDFGWSDVGSFPALDDIFPKNENGTVDRIGDTVEFNSGENIILGTGNRRIVTIGLDNFIVVETEKNILICKKNEAQNIKKILKEISP